MIWIYKDSASTQAAALARALGHGVGRRGRHPGWLNEVAPTDLIINWGGTPLPTRSKILNNRASLQKLALYQRLSRASIPVPEFSLLAPMPAIAPRETHEADDTLEILWEDAVEQADAFLTMKPDKHGIARDAVKEFVTALQRVIAEQEKVAEQPVTQGPVDDGTWRARRDGIGFGDTVATPQFWVKEQTFNEEYIIHVFNGRVILSGLKVPRGHEAAHATIRTWAHGWKVEYGIPISILAQQYAIMAIQSIGLHFGVVTVIAMPTAIGGQIFKVLSVDQTPKLGDAVMPAYVTAIKDYAAALPGV